MSYEAMRWVFENSPTIGNDRFVLTAIAFHAHADGTGAWPSVSTLAAATKLDRRTVQRILRGLEEEGHIAIRPGTGRQSSRYTVLGLHPSLFPGAARGAASGAAPGAAFSASRGGVGAALTRTNGHRTGEPRARARGPRDRAQEIFDSTFPVDTEEVSTNGHGNGHKARRSVAGVLPSA